MGGYGCEKKLIYFENGIYLIIYDIDKIICEGQTNEEGDSFCRNIVAFRSLF